jgi:hypothetical protein
MNCLVIRAEQTVSIELRGQPSGPSVVEVAVKYANIDRPQTKTIRVIPAMKSLRAKLDALLRSQSAAAAKKLMSGAMADDELRQLEQVQKLLNFVPQENKATLFAAGAVAVTCLVGACVLWTIRLPTHVQMNVTSDSVTIKLANELSWSGNWDLSGGLLRLEDMSRIEIPPELANANLLSGRPWLEISNGDFGLKHLEVQSNAQVSVKRTEFHTLKISSWNAPLLGQLEVFGTPRMQAGLSPEQAEKLPETHFEIPGTITFYHDASQTPAILRIAPRGSIELTDLAVQELSFAREVTDSETSFRSGIVKGNLTILSTGEICL